MTRPGEKNSRGETGIRSRICCSRGVCVTSRPPWRSENVVCTVSDVGLYGRHAFIRVNQRRHVQKMFYLCVCLFVFVCLFVCF